MLKRMKTWLRQLWEDWRHPLDYRFERRQDVPEQLGPKRIYLVGEPDVPWVAVFYCPCGCGEPVYLNLLTDTRPCWRFRTVGHKISFQPSVWKKNGCKSHYFIKDGRVNWV